MRREPYWKAKDLRLVRSDTGDGGWSLHAPWAMPSEIANGDEPPLQDGPGECDEHGNWLRPDADDYRWVLHILEARQETEERAQQRKAE